MKLDKDGTLKPNKNHSEINYQLSGERYSSNDHRTVNENRRESIDAYSSIPKKPRKEKVNISVRRANLKNNKNYDYLEVEITDPADSKGKLSLFTENFSRY